MCSSYRIASPHSAPQGLTRRLHLIQRRCCKALSDAPSLMRMRAPVPWCWSTSVSPFLVRGRAPVSRRGPVPHSRCVSGSLPPRAAPGTAPLVPCRPSARPCRPHSHPLPRVPSSSSSSSAPWLVWTDCCEPSLLIILLLLPLLVLVLRTNTPATSVLHVL